VRLPDRRIAARFQRGLLAWYRRHGRDLPWRRTREPYRILVSEIMLQQTQVERVLPKYRQFLARYPTMQALAAAPVDEVRRLAATDANRLERIAAGWARPLATLIRAALASGGAPPSHK
jgi:endonuclease III